MDYTPDTGFEIDQPGTYTPNNRFGFPFEYTPDYYPRKKFQFTAEEDYTPTLEFTFPVNWEEIWRLELPMQLDMEWFQDKVDVTQGNARFGWDLTAPTTPVGVLTQEWYLEAPETKDASVRLGWALIPPDMWSALGELTWYQLAPEYTDSPAEFTWSVNPPVFHDVPHYSRWALNAPDAPIGYLTQEWYQEAPAVWTKVISSTAYLFTLEHPDLGVTEYPISNFSGQFRSGQNSYLQASIPNATRYAETIAAYAAQETTEMVIRAGNRWNDGSYTTQEIARVTLAHMRLDYGTKSSTVSLDGMDLRTNPAPKTVALTGASYRSVADSGIVRYRCSINFDLRAGDTVTVNGETFVVGELSYQVDSNNATMEVAQANG